MEKNKKKEFKVLTWDFNNDNLEHYDVLPYFRNCYKERKKKAKLKSTQKALKEDPSYKKYYGVPETFEEMKEFVTTESLYMYWSRCEYEMIVHGWPVCNYKYKLDVHEQILMNIDIISEILFEEFNKKKKK